MKFKRTESFRHVFERRVEVEYKLVMGEPGSEIFSRSDSCDLVDLSPSGAKIGLSESLPTESQLIRIELNFVLYAKPISVQGEVKWKRIQNGEFVYGIDLDTDEIIEALIISELKLRRRQEVKEKKLNL